MIASPRLSPRSLSPLSLKVFKHHWAELAIQYPVTNNDAALLFRAITELVLSSYLPPCSSLDTGSPIAMTDSLSDRIECLVAHFPRDLAPLCRDLARACVNTLQSTQSAVD